MRVPQVVRWPGVIKPGTVVNEIMSHEDWLPTFLAAAGDPNIKEKLKKGQKAAGKKFKTHLDGYSFMPFFKGEVAKVPRREIFYFDDNSSLNAVRVNDWKIHNKVQEGNLQDSVLRSVNMPYVIYLRQDPYQLFMRESKMYFRWFAYKLWTFVPAQGVVGEFVARWKEIASHTRSSGITNKAFLGKLKLINFLCIFTQNLGSARLSRLMKIIIKQL